MGPFSTRCAPQETRIFASIVFMAKIENQWAAFPDIRDNLEGEIVDDDNVDTEVMNLKSYHDCDDL